MDAARGDGMNRCLEKEWNEPMLPIGKEETNAGRLDGLSGCCQMGLNEQMLWERDGNSGCG